MSQSSGLSCALPLGYVPNAAGEGVYDPDAQVQHVARLIVRHFAALGPWHALLRYRVPHEIPLGVRLREGPITGTLGWRRPNRMTLPNRLKHPLSAGATTYGRRQVDPRTQPPGRLRTGRVTRPRHAYQAFLKEHVPAYRPWAQDEQHLARVAANRARAETLGAVRHGPSRLAGFLGCGRCHGRMQGREGGPRQRHRDTCHRVATNDGGEYCQSLPGAPVEAFVRQWVLTARAPAALTRSLEATARLEQERQDRARRWHQRLERATYETERAARHDRLVEPEPRRVARQLAKEWEAKLTTQRQLPEAYARVVQAQPRRLSAAERATIAQLAYNMPALWQAPTTTRAERTELVRQIIPRVIVAGEGTSDLLQGTSERVGGGTTAGIVPRPLHGIEHGSDDPLVCARLRTLAQAGDRAAQITASLAQEGVHSPKQGRPCSRQSVHALMRRLGRHQPRRRRRLPLGEHTWWLSDLARVLGLANSPLHRWRPCGGLHARWHPQCPRRVARVDAAELAQLKPRWALPAGAEHRKRWLDLPPSHPTAALHITHV